MKKIPTIFKRDPENMARLIDEPHPDCQWVFDGEGVATRKYDGTSCMIKDGEFYKRREVKKGKKPPPDFLEETFDENTGKRTGWVPVTDEDKWHNDGFQQTGVSMLNCDLPDDYLRDGTFELIGPKVQGNPENALVHLLTRHDEAQVLGAPRSYHELRVWLDGQDIEGLVWHHDDGRMAKVKLRDFGLSRSS